MNPEKIIVTRHGALIDYLQEKGIVGDATPVISHANPENVRGKHVVGVLPLHLAVEADRVTEVPLDIPAELRGQELTLDQLREYARPVRTYKVLPG